MAQHDGRIIELCGQLVSAPSATPPGDTRGPAQITLDSLAQLHLAAELRADDPTKPSVVCTVDSGRPGRHLILNCHLDTMSPGELDRWSVDPWKLTRRQGRLYGLGVGNMKGAVAAMVHTLAVANDMKDVWCGRITLCAVSDEVGFGDHGAGWLLASDPSLYGDALICGEGAGNQRLAVAEKGLLWLRISAEGQPGHASKARLRSTASAKLVEALNRIEALNERPSVLPDDLAHAVHASSDYGTRLTINIGTMQAGTFIGLCATRSSAEIDIRLPPGDTCDEVECRIRRIINDIDVHVDRIKGWDPNWTPPASAIASAFQEAAVSVSGHPAPLAIRQPASDASRWRRNSVPAICFGPQPLESMDIDDYAEEHEVLRCARLYALTALNFLHHA